MGKKVKKLKARATLNHDENGENVVAGGRSRRIAGKSSSTTSPSGEKSSQKSSGSSSKYTAEQLLAKAEECVDRFDYEFAEKFCARAVESEPENITALEMMGFLKMQLGDLKNAQIMFNKVIQIQPDTGYSKYMQLGQISTGSDAIQCYTKGIEIMKQLLNEPRSEATEDAACSDMKSEVTVRDVSSAYCAIAELYLTDSCFEEDAEMKCHQNINLAIESDATNPEAYQVLASYCLCKDDKKGASEALEKGLSLWLPQLRDEHKPQDGTDASSIQQIPDPVLTCSVSYSVRISYSKTAIELENYEVAQEILGFLLLEDSQVVEVWYLLGWLNYLRGEAFHSDAKYHLSKGLELAMKTKFVDEQIIDHMNELLSQIGPASDSDLEEEGEEVLTDSDSDNDPNVNQSEENMEH